MSDLTRRELDMGWAAHCCPAHGFQAAAKISTQVWCRCGELCPPFRGKFHITRILPKGRLHMVDTITNEIVDLKALRKMRKNARMVEPKIKVVPRRKPRARNSRRR